MPTTPTSHRKLTAAALACLAVGVVAIPGTGATSTDGAASPHQTSHHFGRAPAHVPPAIRDAG